jgi:hypothetical protein
MQKWLGDDTMLRSDQGLGQRRPAPRWRERWPDRAGYAAAAWSFGYGVLGVSWTLGGAGYPFGLNGPGSQLSMFANVEADTGAPVIAGLGLLGALAALAMVRARGRSGLRVGLLAFAWATAVVLLLVVPDARALVAVAYAPVALIAALIGHPPDDYRKAVPWPVLNQFVCLVGGLLWAATALAYQLRAPGLRDVPPGRRQPAAWTTPASAARWGRWATWAAAIVPLVYAATRWTWALGIPLGIDAELLRAAGTGVWAGAMLGTVAICGAGLTLGLIQRWGETFPRLLPLVGGGSVPMALAIVPATVVAILVTAAGLMFWRRTLLGVGAFTLSGGSWAALAPELLWPFWGVALGAATLAYYLRRRAVDAQPDGRPCVGRQPGGQLRRSRSSCPAGARKDSHRMTAE